MIDSLPWLPAKHSNLLKKTVYHVFREEILPNLPVKVFGKHFSKDEVRPTKDLQSVVGLFILQALLDLTDVETVQSFCFHDTFRYALDSPRDCYLSERSYYYYRSMLLGEGNEVFEAVLVRIKDRLNFDHKIQRKDSTLVSTWLKRMSRLELFRATIRKFLAELKNCHPIIFSRIPDLLREKYLPSVEGDSWFAGDKPSQYEGRLIDAAKDVLWLIDQFKGHTSVSVLKPFELLQRLATEQIQVSDDKVEVKLNEEFRGRAMVNPHDPEARYDGHRKEVGYQVQLTETCSASKDIDHPKIITQIEIEPANTSDVQNVVSGIEKLEEVGLKPDTLLTDNGFACDKNHQDLKELNVDHVCPPAGELPDGFGVIDFTIKDGERITHCPLRKPCLENKVNVTKKATASYFDVETCRSCPHSQDCPVKITKRKAKLDLAWKRPRLEARRLQFAEDESVKQLFRQRSGGEAPFSILKNVMGLDRIRRRGLAKTTLMVFLAATALNVLRTLQWLLRKAKEALSKSKNRWYIYLNSAFRRILCPVSTEIWFRLIYGQAELEMAA